MSLGAAYGRFHCFYLVIEEESVTQRKLGIGWSKIPSSSGSRIQLFKLHINVIFMIFLLKPLSAKPQKGRKSVYDSDGRTIRTRITMDPSAYRFQSSQSRKAYDQLSSITDFQQSMRSRGMTTINSRQTTTKTSAVSPQSGLTATTRTLHGVLMMKTNKQHSSPTGVPKRRILTKKSLKEFEKTPQGICLFIYRFFLFVLLFCCSVSRDRCFHRHTFTVMENIFCFSYKTTIKQYDCQKSFIFGKLYHKITLFLKIQMC